MRTALMNKAAASALYNALFYDTIIRSLMYYQFVTGFMVNIAFYFSQ